MDLLAAAASAYSSAAYLRKRRHRFKQFTYGAQWGDSVRDHDGRWVTEGEMAARNGRVPMTNNMIRRLVKNIVGRFRSDPPVRGGVPDPVSGSTMWIRGVSSSTGCPTPEPLMWRWWG